MVYNTVGDRLIDSFYDTPQSHGCDTIENYLVYACRYNCLDNNLHSNRAVQLSNLPSPIQQSSHRIFACNIDHAPPSNNPAYDGAHALLPADRYKSPKMDAPDPNCHSIYLVILKQWENEIKKKINETKQVYLYRWAISLTYHFAINSAWLLFSRFSPFCHRTNGF